MSEPLKLQHYSRQEFLEEVWDYEPGQHVTIIGRSGSGKSTLGFQLLEHSISRDLPAVTLVSKPKDPATLEAAQRMQHRVLKDWPSRWDFLYKKRTGKMVWPRHAFDLEIDERMHQTLFRQVVMDCYRDGDKVLYVPDLYGLILRYGLTEEFQTIWVNGRAMGLGLWVDTQKPTHIPLLAYNQAIHVFVARDADKRNRERFSEIGGLDGDLIARANLQLDDHEFLYIRQTDQTMCVIEA